MLRVISETRLPNATRGKAGGRAQPAELNWDISAEREENALLVGQPAGENRQTVVAEAEEALIKNGVQVGGQKEAVEDVEALGVGMAFGPGLAWLARSVSGRSRPVTAQTPRH